jgi:NitT/TauT family transport system permease protein
MITMSIQHTADIVENPFARIASTLAVTGAVRTIVMGAAGLLTTLVFWQLVVWLLAVPNYLVPSPIEVAIAVSTDYRLLMSSAAPTILEALLGFLIGNIVALLVAVSFVYAKTVEEMFYPVAILIRPSRSSP